MIQRRIVERTLVDVRRGRLGQPTESCVSDLRRETVLAEWRNVSAAKIVVTRDKHAMRRTGQGYRLEQAREKSATEGREGDA